MAEKKSDKKMPAWLKGKYTEAKDEKKDAKMTKGLSPKEKAEFKKKDKEHAKPKTMKEDKAKDAKIIKGIKKHSAHEKAEGKKGEKAEHKGKAKK
jgi:hypothetical protein